MFGYVIINEPELKIKDYREYRGVYCGLCEAGTTAEDVVSFVKVPNRLACNFTDSISKEEAIAINPE